MAYLWERDVDLEAKTVKVAVSPAHAPKNESSRRTLPVCDAVRDALSAWIGRMAERHPDGYLFFPRKTEHRKRTAKDVASRTGAYCMDYVSRGWTRVLKRARESGVDLPGRFVARKLRGSFSTATMARDAPYASLQRYMGHTVPTVLSRHYDRVSQDRLRRIADLAQRVFEGADGDADGGKADGGGDAPAGSEATATS